MPLNISGSIVNAGIAKTLNYSSIVTRGLVFQADAGAPDSYPETGTSWTDISGNNVVTTLTNGPTFSSDTGGYFSFDGTNDYSINTSFTAFQTTTGTIAAWAYPTQNSLNKYVVSVGDAGVGTTRAIRVVNGNWGTVTNGGGANEDFNDIVAATVNVWQYVAFVWSGTTVNFYLNGTLYSATRSGMVTPGGTSIVIGGPPWLETFWQGRIANAQVYNRTLSTAEVVQNYNAQRGRFGV